MNETTPQAPGAKVELSLELLNEKITSMQEYLVVREQNQDSLLKILKDKIEDMENAQPEIVSLPEAAENELLKMREFMITTLHYKG